MAFFIRVENLRGLLKTLFALSLVAAIGPVFAGDLQTIGQTALLSSYPALTGSGINVSQPEAEVTGSNDWELYPPDDGQPMSFCTWLNTNGVATNFPNLLGKYSGHAGQVGNNFYGIGTGIAQGIAHVDNSDADYFFNYLIQSNQPGPDLIVNQSWVFLDTTISDQQQLDSIYDNYIDVYSNLFCTGVGDGGPVNPPATCYNGLGVGAYGPGAGTSIGPTPDNGRSKPDLVAPGGYSSFSTPYVSGAGAVLRQAIANGLAGTNSVAAGDVRTLRGLLLNGAVKPSDWSQTPTAPLDPRYGSGVLNILYSVEQLAAGRQPFSSSLSYLSGGSHLPGTPTHVVSSPLGWDFESIGQFPFDDTVNHYYFNNPAGGLSTLTATLEWNRDLNQTSINNLALFIYNTTNSELITNSVSTVDNMQHIYVASLPPGQYDLQVVKYGSPSEPAVTETYALAYQFYPITPLPLGISVSNGVANISWPATPTIFNLLQATNLTEPISWTPVSTVGLLANGLVNVSLNQTNLAAFYKLSR